jgi:hypothetical protein
MRVPFGDEKVSRIFWFDVAEPLPPSYRIPFPPKSIDMNESFVTMNSTHIRIAEFRLGKLITDLNPDGITGYCFYKWV